MVMAALHPTGEVGLVGSAELPQPDNIAAKATHTGIRINMSRMCMNVLLQSICRAMISKLELLHFKTPLPPSVM